MCMYTAEDTEDAEKIMRNDLLKRVHTADYTCFPETSQYQI